MPSTATSIPRIALCRAHRLWPHGHNIACNHPLIELAFKAMKVVLAAGANFRNGGENYEKPERNSLHLLNEYLTKCPEDAENIVLSIKGGSIPGEMRPDGSVQNVQRSIDECLRVLNGKNFLDMFERARIDPNLSYEITIAQSTSWGGEIGKAASLAKISAVKVEFSLFLTDILEIGFASACAELGIPIIAYSLMSRWFLTGDIKKLKDIPEGDLRRHFPRFQGEAFYENLKLVAEVDKVSAKKKANSAQVAIA